ncbi:unnamed protein product [Merluccius merluccius]
MSAGDVVCTGWLIKSPPEKKLKRFTWRKRWFVLRCGRMSGNPDVLEYYQSKASRKPIRIIDLRECEVHTQTGGLLLKRSLHQKFPFIVKTSTRIFYLVAKTEEEMNVWIDRIGQICQFGALKDAAESSDEGFPHTPTTNQHSPISLPRDPQDPQVSMSHLQEPSHPLDYLFLSQCETGRQSVCISRCESFSTSECSLEMRRSSDPEENVCSYSFSSPPSNLPLHCCAFRPPLSAPCPMTLDSSSRLLTSSSSALPQNSAPSVFHFDEPFPLSSSSSPPSSMCTHQHSAPPLPPKPCQQSPSRGPWPANKLALFENPRQIPRRTSFSGLGVWTGNDDSFSLRNKRLSLNLPLQHFCSVPVPSCNTDPYVPMSSPLTRCSDDGSSDGYLPMKPLGGPGAGLERPGVQGPLGGQRDDFRPPPINRHLKPRRRARPPPLDLRGLSTIREFPTEPPSGLSMTSSGDTVDSFMTGRRYENEDLDTDDCYTAMDPKFLHLSEVAVGPWTRRSNLDYLSLDFNSASPSPVQKKALLADEHKVDYVQVDEKKTQALQSTRLEWTDVRQSKT